MDKVSTNLGFEYANSFLDLTLQSLSFRKRVFRFGKSVTRCQSSDPL